MTFSTNALPADTYWITVVQALGVSVFMALAAVISGVVINVGLEVKAVKEVSGHNQRLALSFFWEEELERGGVFVVCAIRERVLVLLNQTN